jgi:hypothetical protein
LEQNYEDGRSAEQNCFLTSLVLCRAAANKVRGKNNRIKKKTLQFPDDVLICGKGK